MDGNANSNNLGVFEVPGMAYGLFVKECFSIQDSVICIYHGKQISRNKAYAKMQQSNYIVEVTDHYRLPLSIDG